jgi:hypothetical protein
MASTPDIKVQEAPKAEAPLVNQSGYFDKLRQQKQRKGFLSTFLKEGAAANALEKPTGNVPSSNNTAQRLSEYLGAAKPQTLTKQEVAK